MPEQNEQQQQQAAEPVNTAEVVNNQEPTNQVQDTQNKAEEQSPDPTPTQVSEPQKEDKIEDKLTESGFDYKALEKEYLDNNGELLKETREKLNKQGFSNEFIDDFINGKKALYEQEINELAEVIGGRQIYDEVIRFASENLEPEVINSINQIRDKNVLKLLLPVLKSQMEEKEGTPPEITLQGNGGSQNIELFESQQQMFEAIRDPRYKNDPAYQAKVTKRIRASREAGIDLGI